ncbi:MAG TPA: MTH1187 family thiamine-binding protein [Nitrososphaera sp.]|jgi:uncharacterized protein (TIGR00106 family)
MTVHAEISIVPISGGKGSSMSKQIAAAFNAIRNTKNIKADLTPLGTQVEARDLASVLRAVEAAHMAAMSAGTKRVITTVKIDDRRDKTQTLQDKVESVKRKLKK